MSITEDQIKEAFDQFDADGSGAISAEEIKKVCEALGVDASNKEVETLINEADADGDGKIQYSEFKSAIMG